MQSDAATVDAYLETVPPERRPVLEAVRQLIQRVAPAAEETMKHRMPTYLVDGRDLVAFASQKQYMSVYVMDDDAMQAHQDRLPECDIGKCCIRFKRDEQLDLGVLEDLLREARPLADRKG